MAIRSKHRLAYPDVICHDCGIAYGKRKDYTGMVATWYPGVCDVCGAITSVTEPRDFGHLHPIWETVAVRDKKPYIRNIGNG